MQTLLKIFELVIVPLMTESLAACVKWDKNCISFAMYETVEGMTDIGIKPLRT